MNRVDQSTSSAQVEWAILKEFNLIKELGHEDAEMLPQGLQSHHTQGLLAFRTSSVVQGSLMMAHTSKKLMSFLKSHSNYLTLNAGEESDPTKRRSISSKA